MEDPDEEDRRRKAIYDKIPSETVRDAAGLAKELEWRVERELPSGYDGEEAVAEGEGLVNVKRKASAAAKKKAKGLIMSQPVSRKWHFNPA